jgi:hypothetical protein
VSRARTAKAKIARSGDPARAAFIKRAHEALETLPDDPDPWISHCDGRALDVIYTALFALERPRDPLLWDLIRRMRNLAHGARNPHDPFKAGIVYLVEWLDALARSRDRTVLAQRAEWVVSYAPDLVKDLRLFQGLDPKEARAIVDGLFDSPPRAIVSELLYRALKRGVRIDGWVGANRQQVGKRVDQAVRDEERARTREDREARRTLEIYELAVTTAERLRRNM